jgi:hypothetical protein
MAIPQSSVLSRNAGAFEGMVDHSDPTLNIRSYWNSETTDEIAFGKMVIRGTAEDFAALKLHTSGATVVGLLAGVVCHSHGYSRDSELGSTGLKPGVMMGLLQRGRIWVKVEDAVDPGDTVRVRWNTDSDGPGSFRTAADSTDTIALATTMARWLTSAGAGELALVEIDMLGAIATAD